MAAAIVSVTCCAGGAACHRLLLMSHSHAHTDYAASTNSTNNTYNTYNTSNAVSASNANNGRHGTDDKAEQPSSRRCTRSRGCGDDSANGDAHAASHVITSAAASSVNGGISSVTTGVSSVNGGASAAVAGAAGPSHAVGVRGGGSSAAAQLEAQMRRIATQTTSTSSLVAEASPTDSARPSSDNAEVGVVHDGAGSVTSSHSRPQTLVVSSYDLCNLRGFPAFERSRGHHAQSCCSAKARWCPPTVVVPRASSMLVERICTPTDAAVSEDARTRGLTALFGRAPRLLHDGDVFAVPLPSLGIRWPPRSPGTAPDGISYTGTVYYRVKSIEPEAAHPSAAGSGSTQAAGGPHAQLPVYGLVSTAWTRLVEQGGVQHGLAPPPCCAVPPAWPAALRAAPTEEASNEAEIVFLPECFAAMERRATGVPLECLAAARLSNGRERDVHHRVYRPLLEAARPALAYRECEVRQPALRGYSQVPASFNNTSITRPLVLLHGPDGCGKRTAVCSAARALWLNYVEVNAALVCAGIVSSTDGSNSNRSRTRQSVEAALAAAVTEAARRYYPCLVHVRRLESVLATAGAAASSGGANSGAGDGQLSPQVWQLVRAAQLLAGLQLNAVDAAADAPAATAAHTPADESERDAVVDRRRHQQAPLWPDRDAVPAMLLDTEWEAVPAPTAASLGAAAAAPAPMLASPEAPVTRSPASCEAHTTIPHSESCCIVVSVSSPEILPSPLRQCFSAEVAMPRWSTAQRVRYLDACLRGIDIDQGAIDSVVTAVCQSTLLSAAPPRELATFAGTLREALETRLRDDALGAAPSSSRASIAVADVDAALKSLKVRDSCARSRPRTHISYHHGCLKYAQRLSILLHTSTIHCIVCSSCIRKLLTRRACQTFPGMMSADWQTRSEKSWTWWT